MRMEAQKSGGPASTLERRCIALRKLGAILAGVAGIGGILGGVTGYWSTYHALTTELLAPGGQKPVASAPSVAVWRLANPGADASGDYVLIVCKSCEVQQGLLNSVH